MRGILESKKAISKTLAIALIAVIVVAAVSAVVYFYVFQPGQPTETIKIGAMPPLTGEGEGYGTEWKRIADMFMEEYNEAGGIPSGPLKGRKVELVYADSQSSVDVGVTEAERLITEEKVCMLTGIIYSSITKGVFSVTEREEIPLITAGASSRELTRMDKKWFWRIQAHDEMCIQAMFVFLKDLNEKNPGAINTIAAMYANDEFGVASADAVKYWNADPELGGYELVADVFYPPDAADLSSECLTLKAANPDVVFAMSHTPDSILIAKAFKEQGVNPKLIIAQDGGFITEQFRDALGTLADGIISRAQWAPDIKGKPIIDKYKALWEDEYGYPMTELQGRYWMEPFVACKALELAGSTDNEELRDALNDMDISADECITPWGVKFSALDAEPDGQQNMRPAESLIMIQYFGDELYTVWPSKYASKDLVFPVDFFTYES